MKIFFKKIRSIYRRKKQAIARAHYQAMVWDADHIPNPQRPPATDYGWEADEDHIFPVTTEDPPAPGTITQLIKCGCTLFLQIEQFELLRVMHVWGR